jgi:hypothetical protein
MTGEASVFGGEHRLFNPRSDQWEAHFAWSADYLRILPLNGVGDATIRELTTRYDRGRHSGASDVCCFA